MTKNKQLFINMLASFITLGVNMVIGFFLTPYIVNTISSEAYGFVSLANNIVGYAAIITIALNSVAGRFITISIHQNNDIEANQYFSSVLIANGFVALILVPIAILFTLKLNYFLQIPEDLIPSVKILFGFIFINFIISIISTVYTVATFITNKLYISSIITAFSNVVKVFLFLLLFYLLKPNVAIIGFGTLICSLLMLIANIYYTKKLVPTLIVRKKHFSISKIKKLISSGIWNVVTRFAQILSDGLDLLLTNVWISAYVMGQFSIAKTILTLMGTFISTVSGLFGPQLTLLYAKNDKIGLVKEIKLNMKTTSFFSNIPFCFLIIFGDIFYSLWVPKQDIHMIQLLTIISIQAVLVSGSTNVLYNVFLITNKLKVTSLFWLFTGIFNITLVSILIKNTNLGVYAVAGVSTSVGLIAHLTFLPIYACKCLEIKWNSFHPIIFRYIGTTIIIVIIFYIIRHFAHFYYTWHLLVIYLLCSVIIGMFINYILLFNGDERMRFIKIIKTKMYI